MEKIIEVIEQIKEIVDHGTVEDVKSVSILAKKHADACLDVMDRARSCNRLIVADQQAEAVKLARQAPDLQKCYEEILFENINKWWEMCEKYDLPRMHIVTPFEIECAISEIYAETEDLKRLKSKYILLCLSRADLSSRLHLLHKLGVMDSGEEAWGKQVVTLETARIKEMASEANVAFKAGDIGKIELLLSELGNADWVAPTVQKLKSHLSELYKPLQKRKVRDRYDQLSLKIDLAYSNENYNDLVNLFKKWDDLAISFEIAPSALQAEKIEPCRNWCKQASSIQKKDADFLKSCHLVEQLLDTDCRDVIELDDMMSGVLKFDMGVPDMLAVRFNSRRSEIEKGSKQKFKAIIALVAIVLILIGVAGAMFLKKKNFEKLVDFYENQLTVKLDENDIDGATVIFDEIKSDDYRQLLDQASIGKLHARFNSMVIKDDERKEALVALFKTFDGNLADNKSIYKSDLIKAQKLTRNETEKNDYESYKNKYNKIENNRINILNDGYKIEIKDLQEKVLKLNSNYDSENNSENAELASDCIRIARQLYAKPDASDINIKKVNGLLNAAKQRLIIIDASIKLAKNLDSLNQSMINKRDSYMSTLEAFAKDFPEESISKNKELILQYLPIINQYFSWNSIHNKYQGDVLNPYIDVIKRRLALFEQYPAARYEEHYIGARYHKYLTFLQSSSEKNSSEIFNDIFDYIDLPRIAHAKVITEGNKTFYVSNVLTRDLARSFIIDRKVSINYYYESSDRTKNTEVLYNNISNSLNDAPHSELARTVRTMLEDYDPQKQTIYEFIVTCIDTVTTNEKSNRIFSAILVKKLLSKLHKNLYFDSTAIKKLSNDLDKGIDLDVNWMDPDSTYAAETLSTIKLKFTRMIKNLPDIKDDINQENQSLIDDFVSYTPISLYYGKSHKINIDSTILNQEVDLYGLIMNGVNTGMQKIGKYNNGQAAINSNVDFAAGNVMFIKSKYEVK